MDFRKERKIIKSRFRITSRQMRNTNDLIENVHSLLQSGAFSDITLHCGSEVFRVHKNILSARSPVFAAMFLNPMRESGQDFMNIQGMEPSTLRIMLGYIYSSKTEPLNASLACELLSAADMYQLAGLKRICIDFLRYVMCNENVLHIVKIADLYDENLRADACKFICEKYEFFEHKPEWKVLQEECPQIVIEIMALKINMLKCADFYYPSDTEMKMIKETKRKVSETILN